MKFGIKFAIVTGLQVACLFGMIGYKYRSLSEGTDVILEVPRPKDPRSLFSGDYVIVNYTINTLNLEDLPNNVENVSYNSTVYVELEQRGAIWVPIGVYDEPTSKLFIKGEVKDYQTSGKLFLSFSEEQIAALEKMVRKFEESNDPPTLIAINTSPFEELDLTNLSMPDSTGKNEFPEGSKVYISIVYSNQTLRATAITNEKPNEYLTSIYLQGTVNRSLSYKRLFVNYGIENCFVPESTGRDMEQILRDVQKAKVHIDPGGNGTIIGVPENNGLRKCGS